MPNPCNWPDFCGPQTARVMLDEIVALAEQEIPKEGVDPRVLDRIRDRARDCKSPLLQNKLGTQVCHLHNPLPCDELAGIKLHAEDPAYAGLDTHGKPLPATPEGHWLTIAQELESFPTGA